ncbi:MAG TPA: hypothetical protein VK390_10485 [Propionibacteriaceae bacterium]|nr:hypothetical protein [Propionibacteriaceae bacterium]
MTWTADQLRTFLEAPAGNATIFYALHRRVGRAAALTAALIGRR